MSIFMVVFASATEWQCEFLKSSFCSHTFSSNLAVLSPVWSLDLDKTVYLTAVICGGEQHVCKCVQTTASYKMKQHLI